MPRFNMVLEEQLSDSRSSEAAFRVKLENLGTSPFEVLRINPRIPEGVTLVEVKDSSTEAARIKYKKLCEDLTELLDQHVFVSSETERDARLKIDKQYLADFIKDANAIWRIYLNLFTGVLLKRMREYRERIAAHKFIIRNKDDADIALHSWFASPIQADHFARLFNAKYAQLVSIENEINNGPATSALATIEPDSFFATTYVLRFPRSALNPTKFSFSVEAALSEPGSPKEILTSSTAIIEISPRPYVLSLITMMSALLGVAVKFSIDHSGGSTSSVRSFFGGLGQAVFTGSGISAIVLAIVLFNVYDYLEFGEKIKMRVGWRSAMLIGVLAGLFTERFIAALKALIGA
jgi:hypothetical protein